MAHVVNATVHVVMVINVPHAPAAAPIIVGDITHAIMKNEVALDTLQVGERAGACGILAMTHRHVGDVSCDAMYQPYFPTFIAPLVC
jgi:3-deoxy-D-arabino-heptulosonate 7-phosphate (DAHP) synthase